MHPRKPLVLLILDGWGYQEENNYNAIAAAHTPQWDEWWRTYPHMILNASGTGVGLPEQQMGNSEVGHMHIGAGRVIHQDFTRINQAINTKEFDENPVFLNLITQLKQNHKALHIMGLLSEGGIHSHQNHLFSFLKLCHQQQFTNIFLHLFLDGRDSPPQSALHHLIALKKHLHRYPVATIASLCGRYFALDRDKRWERTEPVYRLLTEAQSEYQFPEVETAVQAFYEVKTYDEFIPPTLIGDGRAIEDGDSLFFFNFRADRARQLTEAFISPDFQGFLRPRQPTLSHFVTMTRYAKNLATDYAFSPLTLKNTFGEVIAQAGLKQLRLAETEKYAHVTFFFNGGCEEIFTQEERSLIPSPKVATYNLTPEMSAPELTKVLTEAMTSQRYDVIICNYANADMVGHSGDFQATIKAVECLDRCLQQIGETLALCEGNLLITADHGNAEVMFDLKTQQAHTAHTCQPVPLLFVGRDWHFHQQEGSLIDIAPTLLALLGIAQPHEMTGHCLLTKNFT